MRRVFVVAAVSGAFVFLNTGSAVAQDSEEGAAAAQAVVSGDEPAMQARIAGKWLLNRNASDDPATKLREAFGGRGRPGGGGRRPGGGGGRRPGAGGGGGEGQGGAAGGQRRPGGGGFGDAVEASRELSIAVDDSLVVMIAREGTSRTYRPDGTAVKTTDPRGNEIETVSEWKDAALVVKTSGGRGGAERRYEIDYRTGQLIVTTKLKLPQGGREVEIRTVYEPLGGQED
ncbi:MAG: hypothetical protein V3U67_08195 [Gemmatimonadota bacterium]